MKKNNKGITLIALVITIIVLLILAGVSIATLTGDNGVLKKANSAKLANHAAGIKDERDLWKNANRIVNDTADQEDSKKDKESLSQIVNRLEQTKIVTTEEKEAILKDGYVVVGDETINFSDGLTPQEFVVTRSDEKIIFEDVVKKGDILFEKGTVENFKIMGISNSKDGIFSDSSEGKSGIITIVNGTTDSFEYTLNKFMKGDETFFVKVLADGVEYYQELKVIQGQKVVYEEDFVAIEYGGGNWEAIEDSGAGNGHLKVLDLAKNPGSRPYFKISGIVGSSYDFRVKRDNAITINIRLKGLSSVISFIPIDKFQINENEYINLSRIKNDIFKLFGGNQEAIIETKITTAYFGDYTGSFKLDSIIVYR